MKTKFEKVAANENHPLWTNMISRQENLEHTKNDLRTEFERDYTRVIFTTAYRRLKHKTQVFFLPKSDHICTRIEHANYVESISYTIAKALGLNTNLTKAISTSHDIGHSPFGHAGEKILSKISEIDIGKSFWHEKNGLDIVDNLSLLENKLGMKNNLNLTYAVRDGIISHCGEVNENSLKPRNEFINLESEYTKPNQYAPYTWEACVVKISDKISYILRDIEDAIFLGILDNSLNELKEILKYPKDAILNNTVIINKFIYDLCENSNPENGLTFSKPTLDLLNNIKSFNYKNIYLSEKVLASQAYFDLIINGIYNTLKPAYNGMETLYELNKMVKLYGDLVLPFIDWITPYWNINNTPREHRIIFDMNKKEDYCKAIIYYISGMTDNYAIESFNNIIRF